MTDDEALAGQLSHARLLELHLAPIQGRFDVQHLRAVHRHIFQDFPTHGIAGVTPGALRPPVPSGTYYKFRTMFTVKESSFVAYSTMDTSARKRVDDALAVAKPDALSKLETAAFVQTLATLYAELDYVHPFDEGNSRTLREFTRTLALESGFVLDWTKLGRNESDFDRLYVARDRAVASIALPLLTDAYARMHVQHSVATFEPGPSLPELLGQAVHPARG